MSQSLKDKTALVTGGSRGMGAATAFTLAERGARVALTYNSSADAVAEIVQAITDKGGEARAYQADAAAPETMPALAEAVIADLGGLDILVNNAGIFGGGMIGEIAAEDYQRMMRINVDSVFLLTNALIRHIRDGGRIINLGSVLGERASLPGLSTYNASKAAVAMLTRSWAKDLGPRRINVTCVQPGPVNTDMNPETGDFSETMSGMTALDRYGRPQEVANLIAFLASEESSYITGETINADGGWNA